MMADGSLLRSGGETWGPVSPDNVHETVVSPGRQSGPPIAAVESRAGRINWKKEMVTDPIPRFVPYTVSGMLEPLRTCAVRKRTDS